MPPISAPKWSLADARRLAGEVEYVLRSDDAPAYFRAMYGNDPDRWEESLTGFDRLRVITNHLTRMRFVDERGALDLDTRERTGCRCG